MVLEMVYACVAHRKLSSHRNLSYYKPGQDIGVVMEV